MKHLLSVFFVVLLGAGSAAGQGREAHRLRLADPPARAARSEAPARPGKAPAALADTVIVYDDGSVAVVAEGETTRAEAYALGDSSRQANRFVRPPGGVLTSVAVAPFYENDFAGTGVPDSAARDFRLVLWADDGAGRPGDELFSLDVTDPRANDERSGRFTFLELDTLGFFPDEMEALPDTFYAGLVNAGDDDNYLVMGVSEYDGDNVAFLYLPAFFDGAGGWRAFPEIFSQATRDSLYNRVLPIRATFSRPDAPTASDEAGELPSRVVLYPSFPNPFNPSTTIGYALPQAAEVRLAVYDVLGRRVALLVDGVQAAGEHRVQVEARGWTSGLYFYTIEAAGQRRTQRMALVR